MNKIKKILGITSVSMCLALGLGSFEVNPDSLNLSKFTNFQILSIRNNVAFAAPTELEGANINNMPQKQSVKENISDSKDKNNNEEKEGKKDFQLINDSTNSISNDDKEKISSDLKIIFDQAKRTNANFKMYLFLYDSPQKNVNIASEEITKKSNIPTEITPLVLVINKHNKHYKLIIDERLVGYVSKAFAQSMLDEIILNNETKNWNYDNVGQAMVRLSTITALNIQNKLSGQADLKSEDFRIREDAFMVYNFSGQKIENRKDTDSKENPLEVQKEDSSENNSYEMYAILFVFLSLLIVLYGVRKRRQARMRR